MVLLATTSATPPLNTAISYIAFASNVSGLLRAADPQNGITDVRFFIGRLVDGKNARSELYGFRYARGNGAEGERRHYGRVPRWNFVSSILEHSAFAQTLS